MFKTEVELQILHSNEDDGEGDFRKKCLGSGQFLDKDRGTD